MRLLAILPALVLTLLLAPSSGRAQGPAEQEVRNVIQRLFDGMRRGDSTLVRSTFHPTVRLQSATIRDGQTILSTESIDAFVTAVGTPHPRVWDERVSELEIRIDDPLATAWMNYRFFLGDQFSHCGVNALQLLRGASGWQIIQIVDTRRASCPG